MKKYYSFKDEKNNTHEFSVFNNPNDNTLHVKFDVRNNKSFYKHPNLKDEKIFNTHTNILIDVVLPKFVLDKNTPIYFKADGGDENERKLKHRLYMIMLNKFLDKNLYSIKTDGIFTVISKK